jgi:hypothetical protein
MEPISLTSVYVKFRRRRLGLSEREFRARIVSYILDGRPEHAVKLLSEYYGVSEPELRVGTVKGHRKVLGCYVQKEKRIYLSTSQFLTDPFVILHEFYHHLRASDIAKNRQVEKRADLFALNFIRDLKRFSTTSNR